jgi:hypothetical protein
MIPLLWAFRWYRRRYILRRLEVLWPVDSHGSPRHPELVATATLRWLQSAQIETAFIDPGNRNGTAWTNPSTGKVAQLSCLVSNTNSWPPEWRT